MRKWLAAGALAVIAVLVLIWREVHKTTEVAPAAPAGALAASSAPAVVPTGGVAKVAQLADKVQAQAGKIDPASDEFFYRFDDLQPSMLTRNAASCYTGGLHRVHRNAKVKLAFKDRIKNGVVSVEDVRIVESTIGDQELVACFLREVQKTTWKDDALPDWTQDDQLVIRPERGMKKYTKENMEYEGDGPDFTDQARKAAR
jgi:hypothetical protein